MVDDVFSVIVATTFMVMLGVLWRVRARVANVSLLALLIAMYPISGIQGMLT